MNLFILIILLMIHDIKCEENCKSAGPVSPTNRLMHHLLCNYGRDRMARLYSEKIMTFNLRLIPYNVQFEKQTDTLQFITWLNVSWSDTDLTWEPIKWDGIRWIRNKIEMPLLKLIYGDDIKATNTKLSLKNCLITYDGNIHCVTPATFTCHCPIDYSEWPYDKHNCSTYIGPFEVQYANTIFNFGENPINMTAFRPNNQWHVSIASKLLPIEANINYMNGSRLAISILLERRASGLAMMYTLPIVVFMLMTLIVFWFDCQSLERILVASINLILHLLGLCHLHKSFPTTGSINTPQILLFYEVSIGLAAYALIFTCILRKLTSLKVSAPTWLVSATDLVINSPVTPYVGLTTNRNRQIDALHESDNNGSPNHSTWREFATILEWISFVIVFVTYVTMLGIFLRPKEPKEMSENYLKW